MSEAKANVNQFLPAAPLAQAAELSSACERIQQHAILVTPITRLDYLPPMHAVSFRVVKIDTSVDEKGNGKDVYRSPLFCKANERALTKVGLLKIWSAAGGDILSSGPVPDDINDPLFRHWQVIGEIMEMDGRRRRFVANKTVDLRPGSAQIPRDGDGKVLEKMAEQQRSQIDSLAETKALLRLIRAVLGLPQKYSVDELQKPIVVPTLVFVPDMSDPEIKRMVASSALRSGDMLYGAGPKQLARPDAPSEVIDLPPENDDAPTPGAVAAPSHDQAPWETPPSPGAPTPTAPAFRLPLTPEQIAAAPTDVLNGAPRSQWLARMQGYALQIIQRRGDVAGRIAIDECCVGVDLRSASAGDMSIVGKKLQDAANERGAA